jgi:P-type E1-E2 ATPase
VEVRSGELVPVDGVVLSGRSALDNAVLTGETAPLAVTDGDGVNAGATNLGARLLVRVNATGARTRVGALLAIVQDALSRKPSLLQTTDVMARASCRCCSSWRPPPWASAGRSSVPRWR